MLSLQSAESPVFRVPERSFLCVRSRGLVTARTFSGASDFLAKFHDYGLGMIKITFGQHPSTLDCGLKASPINSVLLSLLLACFSRSTLLRSPELASPQNRHDSSRCQAGSGRWCIIEQLYIFTTSRYVIEASDIQVSTILHYHSPKTPQETVRSPRLSNWLTSIVEHSLPNARVANILRPTIIRPSPHATISPVKAASPHEIPLNCCWV